MAIPKTQKKKTPADQKSEVIIELADRFAYWNGKNEEYAQIYQHMLCAITQPAPADKKE